MSIELYPNSANCYDSLAECYWKSGELDLAIKNYERALAMDPADPTGGKRHPDVIASPCPSSKFLSKVIQGQVVGEVVFNIQANLLGKVIIELIGSSAWI